MTISLRGPQKYLQLLDVWLVHILPERMFSEEGNQPVAIKHESQLFFRIHVLFAVFQRFSTTAVTVA
jgi:hypothetical protein